MVKLADLTKYLPTTQLTIESLPDAATDLMWSVVIPSKGSEGFETSKFSARNLTNTIDKYNPLSKTIEEQKLQIRILSAQIIDATIKTESIPAGHKTIDVPTGTTLGTMTLEFYEDQFFTAREAALKWKNSVVNSSGVFGLPGGGLLGKAGFVDEIEIHIMNSTGLDMLACVVIGYPVKVYDSTLKKTGVSSILTTKVEYTVLESRLLAGLANLGGTITSAMDISRVFGLSI